MKRRRRGKSAPAVRLTGSPKTPIAQGRDHSKGEAVISWIDFRALREKLDFTEVLEGVREGDLVVISDQDKLHPGQVVRRRFIDLPPPQGPL